MGELSKVENLRSGDKGYFRAMLETAYEKRVPITLEQAKSGDLPPVDTNDIQSVVFVPENKSHLYPWIMQTAYLVDLLNTFLPELKQLGFNYSVRGSELQL